MHIYLQLHINILTKYHTWYVYKPDWYTVLLFLAIMWTVNDRHLWLVMFLRHDIHANISSSQYQINKLDTGKILSPWWLQYGIIIIRFKLQLILFPLPPHLTMNRLMIRHWYRIYHCDNECEISNQMAFRTYDENCTWLFFMVWPPSSLECVSMFEDPGKYIQTAYYRLASVTLKNMQTACYSPTMSH